MTHNCTNIVIWAYQKGNASYPSTLFLSFQCLTLGSSSLYKFTKSVSFYNAKPIFTKPNALLAV
ncbi:MAG: hypothetical protein ACEY3F_05655, partial [Wolbachia sp.]